MPVNRGETTGVIQVNRQPVPNGRNLDPTHEAIVHGVHWLANLFVGAQIYPGVKMIISQFPKRTRDVERWGQGRVSNGQIFNLLAEEGAGKSDEMQKEPKPSIHKAEGTHKICYLCEIRTQIMAQSDSLSQSVLQQMDTLLERYRFAVVESERLASLVAETESRLAQIAADALALEAENERLRLAQGINGAPEERAALKAKINEWVREINTCLARLNA